MTRTLAGKERVIVINTLKEIADTAGLGPSDKGRFVKFAIAWFNLNGRKLWADTNYCLEWANRFKKKREYEASDYDRLALLLKVDGMRSAQSRLAQQEGNYYPSYGPRSPQNKPAIEEAKIKLQQALKKTR